MEISKKRAPTIADNDAVERAFGQLYDDLNEVISAVNQGNISDEKKSYEGKPGDIRLVKDSTNEKYYLEAKSEEGWVRSDSATSSGFSFKDIENRE